MATNMASASRKHSNNLVNLANPQPAADSPGMADKEDMVVDRQVMADKAAHKAGAMAKILPRPSEADADRR